MSISKDNSLLIELEFPTTKREKDAFEFIEEFKTFNSVINGTGGLDKVDDYKMWINKTVSNKDGIDLEEDRVPASTFFAVDKTSKVIGMVNIRHELNDYIIERGIGHIGYSVRPTERKKGYATEILRQALEYCMILGIYDVYIGCFKDNIGSIKTIENNGGALVREFVTEDENVNLEYIIKLQNK